MKKNFLKKILSVLLSIMIIFGISIEAYAYENNDSMENDVIFAIKDNFGSLALEIIEMLKFMKLKTLIFQILKYLMKLLSII